MIDSPNRYITHFVLSPPVKSGYEKLSIYTSNDVDFANGIFYYGNGGREINREEMNEKIEDGMVKELTEPIERENLGEIIWLDSNGEYWLANAKNPLKENADGIMKFNGKKIVIP